MLWDGKIYRYCTRRWIFVLHSRTHSLYWLNTTSHSVLRRWTTLDVDWMWAVVEIAPVASVDPFEMPSRSIGQILGSRTFLGRVVLKLSGVSSWSPVFLKHNLVKYGGRGIHPLGARKFLAYNLLNPEAVGLILFKSGGYRGSKNTYSSLSLDSRGWHDLRRPESKLTRTQDGPVLEPDPLFG